MRSLYMALISVATACTTTTGYSRGELVRRTPLDTARTPSAPVLRVRDNVASLVVPTKVCKSYRNEVAKLRDRRTKHPSYVRLFVGLGLGAIGVPLAILGVSSLADSSGGELPKGGVVATIVGAPLALMGPLMASTSPMGGAVVYDHVATGDTYADVETECTDETVAHGEATPWKMSWGRTERSGTTGIDGRLALHLTAYDVLEEVSASQVTPQLLRDGGVELRFQLGPAMSGYRVTAPDVPETTWRAWNASVAKDPDSARRMRLAACRAVRSSERDVQRCVWQHEAALRELSGTLKATGAGDYTVTLDLEGAAGARFSLFFALPYPHLDWYAQVVELDRGEIVTEGLSGSDDRLDLSGTFPRTGTYLITLQAARAGAFKANLVVMK